VLRACGCTGGGNRPSAVQRHTERSLIDKRRATSRTVSKSAVIVREENISDLEKNAVFVNVEPGKRGPRTTSEDTVQTYTLQDQKINFCRMARVGTIWQEMTRENFLRLVAKLFGRQTRRW
jgi:hypothetical protein